ncbi:hypothetical protein [Peribacillus sp. NPDC060253]|uniref:hypothetical protein n=1 Tax=Peribacillus sp. NPDC060253 TaxID=3347084 RepID=UPI0036698629
MQLLDGFIPLKGKLGFWVHVLYWTKLRSDFGEERLPLPFKFVHYTLSNWCAA